MILHDQKIKKIMIIMILSVRSIQNESCGSALLGNRRGKSNPQGLWVRVLEGKGRDSRSVTSDPSLYP